MTIFGLLLLYSVVLCYKGDAHIKTLKIINKILVLSCRFDPKLRYYMKKKKSSGRREIQRG
jgi:hypothetical protein